MSKEILKKIGTAFNTHKSENINKEGIGLGLFICNMIVSQLGPQKKLQIESQINVGSTFKFIIATDYDVYL